MRTVLITGAGKGIGRATAIAFAKAGYNIAINYNNSKESAEALAKIIYDSYNIPALAVKADVTKSNEVKEMINIIEENFKTIDVLVNNAGIAEQKVFTDITEQDWNNMINTNLNGVFICTKAVLPYMLKRKRGSIINISSMWGQTGASCEVHYSAAKAGVIGFTKALAKELGPSQISVNCISPGVINTDMINCFDETVIDSLKKETPLQRIGTPKNIADTAVFLASDNASFITGQVIGINGGMMV